MAEGSKLRVVLQSNYPPREKRRYLDMAGKSIVMRVPDARRTEQIALRLMDRIEREVRRMEAELAEEAYSK